MTAIEGMIAEHCPNGVEFRMLGDIARRNKGVSITAARMKQLHVEGGPIRVFAAGNTTANVAEGAVPESSVIHEPSVIVKSRGRIGFAFYDGRFTHKNEMWSYTFLTGDVDSRFMYHYLLTRVAELQEWARATSVKLPQLSVGDTDRLKVPVPPLVVQREIVGILDKMGALKAELEAELQLRARQYEFYRDSLLAFTEAPPPSLKWLPVSELGNWVGGVTPSKSQPRYWESGTIPWVASMDISATRGNEIRGRVTQAALDETSLRLVSSPSVAVVMRSNILRRSLPVGYIDVDTTANQDMRLLKTKDGVDARYVYQALLAASEEIRKSCVRTDGSMAAVDSKAFFAHQIPVPPLADQHRIVAVLDKFDALVNDLSSGLPAEIAARRRQYEYYRDALLTFEEAS